MAVDLSALNGPVATHVDDLSATGGNAIKFTVPTWCRQIRVVIITSGGAASTGSIGFAGTDDAAANGENHPIPATGLTFPLCSDQQATNNSNTVVYISGDANADDAQLLLTEHIGYLG